MGNIRIWDLDGTVVNSQHRVGPCTKNGVLDIRAYIKTCIPELIHRDSLLPLARLMQKQRQDGDYIIVLTARDMVESDLVYLNRNNLTGHLLCSRNGIGFGFDKLPEFGCTADHYGLPDGLYKSRYLHALAKKGISVHNAVMYDDHPDVIRHCSPMVGKMVDAGKLNKRLECKGLFI